VVSELRKAVWEQLRLCANLHFRNCRLRDSKRWSVCSCKRWRSGRPDQAVCNSEIETRQKFWHNLLQWYAT